MEKGLTENQDSKDGFAEGSAEKRRKFDKVLAVGVSTEGVPHIPRGEGFKKRVIGWLKPLGVIGTHKNADKGWDVIVSKSGILNVLGHGAYGGKTALLEHIPELIKNGVYLETRHKRRGLDSHVFATKAKIDGEDYVVGFVVRDDGTGKRYYDHEIRIDSKEKLWAAADSRKQSSAEAEPQPSPEPPISDSEVFDVVRKHLGNNTNITNSDIKSKGKDENLSDPSGGGNSDTP